MLNRRSSPPSVAKQHKPVSSVQQRPVLPKAVATVSARPPYSVLGALRTAPGVQQIRVAAAGCVQPVASLELHNAGSGKVCIANVFVNPDHRRHGIASQMMNTAIATARRDGFSVAQLEARPGPGSIPAHSLVSMYSGLGFRTVGWSPRGGPIMERVLQHVPRSITPQFAPVPSRSAVPIQPRIRVPVTGTPGIVQRAATFKFGFKESYATDPTQWMESGENTFATLMWDSPDAGLIDLGLAKNVKSAAHGAEHAEDVALRVIHSNLAMFSTAGRNSLILNLTKSPCTSTAWLVGGMPKPATSGKPVGCTESLIALVTGGLTLGLTHYTFSLRITCRGLYCPTIPGHTQADVLAASQAAVNAMKATGHITVTGDERPASSASRFEVQ